jgi:carbon-monoxide dehydrogenase large subunit
MANVIGQRVRRREDPRFITGAGRYVDNMPLDGAVRVGFVRSRVAHGRIAAIDASEAEALPGVRVFTAKDVGLGVVPAPPFGIDERMSRPFLASETVRFVGDIVAIVVAESAAVAADAADLVFVDYEELPVAVDPRAAARDEALLFPEVGTNVATRDDPDSDPDLFAGCDVVVSGTLHSQRMAASPLEPRATAATFADGKLTVWLSTQTPHADRDGIAGFLGMDTADVQAIGPDVGGGFGAKMLYPEDVMICWLARELGRPVRYAETRSENMVAMVQGRAQLADFKLGGDRDGTIKAYRLDLLQDLGAYPGIGAALPGLTKMMASGVYAIPRIEVAIRGVVTNTTPIGAFRGAGRPEATQTIERAMDMYAQEIGMDPAEIRRRNVIGNDHWPYTTASGATYDIGDFGGALDRVLAAASYEELRAEQEARRANGDTRQLGIGLSVYVEVTNGFAESEFAGVEITPEGGAILRTGSFSHGQGHETTFAMIAAEQLGLEMEDVTVHKGDTKDVARGGGTYGSKSTQAGGAAARQVAEAVANRAKEIVADLLEADVADIELGDGRFQVAGSPQSGLSWGELAARLVDDGRLAELKLEDDFKPDAATFPFGAHLAVVEVDTETGGAHVRRMVAVDDAGTIINPLVTDGQVHGGVATGIAQALFEEVGYDAEGNPLTTSFVGYNFPSAAELPSFERVEMVTPTPVNPLGAKGIGESGTIGSTPAVHNAVIDAVAHLGVRHIDMPANGERVWRAIEAARQNGGAAA